MTDMQVEQITEDHSQMTQQESPQHTDWQKLRQEQLEDEPLRAAWASTKEKDSHFVIISTTREINH